MRVYEVSGAGQVPTHGDGSYFNTNCLHPEARGKLCSLLRVSEQVGCVYPKAIYFPIWTLYLTLKIKQRERYKSGPHHRGHVPACGPGLFSF